MTGGAPDPGPATSARRARLQVLRALFASREDPYAGADLSNARRLGALLWLIAVVIAAALLPFFPPTAELGSAGWPVAAALAGLSLVGVYCVARREVSFDQLLVAGYVAMGEIAVLQWLAGGGDAPYQQLYLLAFMFSVAVHPPRRAAAGVAAGSAAFLAPLAYDGFTWAALVGRATQLFIWWGLSLVTMALMSVVRAQRLQGQEADRLARVDSLTGLGNRRAFEECLERELARARRREEPLAFLVADVDGFKPINDGHGHPAGDACLRQVAEALRLTVRGEDLCFRWGGDEFGVLLPNTDRASAVQVRDRLLRTVRAARLGPGNSLLTLSCGIAVWDGASGPDELIAAADRDLLEKKARPTTAVA